MRLISVKPINAARFYAALADSETGVIIKKSNRPCIDFYHAQCAGERMLRRHKGHGITATTIKEGGDMQDSPDPTDFRITKI